MWFLIQMKVPFFFQITYSDSTQTQCVCKRKQNPIIHDIMKYFGPRNETEFTATSPTNRKFRLKTWSAVDKFVHVSLFGTKKNLTDTQEVMLYKDMTG